MEARLELNIEVSSDEDEDGLVTLGELNVRSDSAEDDDLAELLGDTEAFGDRSSSEESDEGEEEEGGASEGDAKRKKPPAAIWGTAAKKLDGCALCLVCNIYVGTPMGSTSGIRNHVKVKHPKSEEYKRFLEEETKQKLELEKMKKKKPQPQTNLFSFFHLKKPLSVFDKERLTESVSDFFGQTNTYRAG